MIIAYLIVAILTTRHFARNYAASHALLANLKEEADALPGSSVRSMLLFSWTVMLFLLVYAKLRLRLPEGLGWMILTSKIPAFILTHRFFETGRFSRAVYAADKLDQVTTLLLCAYAFKYYLFSE